MFLSNLVSTGPLIACGVSLLLAAICYGMYIYTIYTYTVLLTSIVFRILIGIAAFTGQAFASSK